jgi:superfamily II DNA or RNA helicase/diadenosine tetraphosphate (Ap4A) HIT family hydrolase/HKD family nuclease
MSEQCPFCEPSAERVFHEGELAIVLWDAFPVSPAHALIVLRRHVASWFDATRDEQHELLELVDIARDAIEAKQPADGYNIGVNVGATAGQTIPHLHLHVIPRREGDVPDPRGGVRHVLPAKANYLRELEDKDGVGEPVLDWPHKGVNRAHGPAVVGDPSGPLLPHLVEHLDRASQVDLVVAFVLESGVVALENALHGFLQRGGRLRILTGDYLGVTDPRALRRLMDLVGFARSVPSNGGDDPAGGRVQLRVFETSSGSSFHPKAYIFRFGDIASSLQDESLGLAYVGSSNLTRTALRDGIEWNYRLVLGRDRLGFEKVVESFERMFEDQRARPLSEAWIEAYQERRPARKSPAPGVPSEPPPPAPEPHAIQQEALAALAASRRKGHRAGLVVMATGLGKTWLAAFDVNQFRSRRTLFVAHRDEILSQALSTFRRIQPEARLGTYTGKEKVDDADVTFASIQCLGRPNHLRQFAPSAFDYIVVDEFHHADAATYRRLIDHFTPSFLLGLTATPERTDGGNLLGLCEENLVYRCDLFDAIRRQPDRLVPFHYYGVPDDVDYAAIPWRNRKFDVEALTREVATTARAENAFEQWSARAGTRTLGFCCSIVHADFMAAFFQGRGIKAVAVHSAETSAPRATSLQQLADGEVAVVFAVDILNEGVDIPDVDTVLMLRPTESRIVFLQQLGRGLRRAPGKEHLTVVDYIGNHRSFLRKPEVLLQLSPGDAPLRSALDAIQGGRLEELELPPGCSVTYELQALDILKSQLRVPAAVDQLTSWYEEFRERTGGRPLALEALREGRNPRAARPAHGSWTRFVQTRGDVSGSLIEMIDRGEAASRFLEEIETTRMSKAFKMIVLLAMLRKNQLPGVMTIEQLVDDFRTLVKRSERLQSEVTAKLEDDQAMRRYLESNPINAWCKGAGGGTYFEYAEGELKTRFDVAGSVRNEFQLLVRELAEWRIADHVGIGGLAGSESKQIVCKVIQTGGRPILKLPDRGVYPGIPEGEMDVSVDGKSMNARFVKQFVNVLADRDAGENELAAVVREWFGDAAGQPGTRFFVAFTLESGAWSLIPLAPGDATGPTVRGGVASRVAKNVLDDAGNDVDATYSLEAVDGDAQLVFHSAGGTAGTPAARNLEYATGLEILLRRLAAARLALAGIYLDSSRVQDMPLDQRLLALRGGRGYPLELAGENDFPDLRKAVSHAQGKNPNRRIRFTFASDLTLDQLEQVVISGG